jgi:hypothetical protein
MEQDMRNGVSAEQIARAKEISIEEYILTHEPNNIKRVGNAYYLKDHDSLEISNNLWNWHSQGVGGKNVIDFLMKVRGFGFVDAVRQLDGEDYHAYAVSQKARPPTPAVKKQSERREFVLPPRNRDNERVIAYLENRGIDRDIIQDCIERGSLYETANWHNCCFVGRDEQGKAKFAALRGTNGDFKRDAEGSDKRFGFCLPPENPQSNTVFVFESPIDLLSYDTLCKLGNIEPQDGWRLSLGGTAMLALTRLIEQQKFKQPIAHCVVCTDRDTAGDLAFSEIAEKLTIMVSRQIPVGKDWNETLQKIRNEVKFMDDVRKDIIFRGSDYKEKFRIKDGDSIKVTLGYDGEVVTRKCRWIDECHTKIGSEYYHNDEYAEKSARAGNLTEPVASSKPQIDILAAKYGEDLQAVAIPMTEAAIKKLVGGSYQTETLYYPNRTEQIKDRKIEIKGKAFGAVVRGKDGIAVCGLTDGVLTSLHPYNAQTQKRELSPATPAQDGSAPKNSRTQEKTSLLSELAEAKAIVSGRDAARLAPGERPKNRIAAELG